MSHPVLTAITHSDVEARQVTGLRHCAGDVHVVRRCVDVADLLATAAAGLGRAVLLSADLRRLDRESLTRLAVAGVGVVGVVAPDDADGEQRLRRLGIAHLVRTDADPSDVAAALVASVRAPSTINGAATAAAGALGDGRVPVQGDGSADDEAPVDRGRVVAVWGATGAPGRSTLAVNLAAELAALGRSVLLVDADGYGGAVAQLLGLLDEAAGLASACRLANSGALDAAALSELAVEVRPGLRVLTGITRADRWPELRPSALDVVLDLARDLAAVTVVDCGFCLEHDEELSFDTAAPRRNGATLTALAAADTVLAVATADPVGLQRLVRGLGGLAECVPEAQPVTVVNRLRPAAVGGGDPREEIRTALERYAGLRDLHFVPLDMPAYDAAVAAGRTLAEVAPASPARTAIRELAALLTDAPPLVQRARLFRRRRAART
jgi:Flp pilus assembly CpaE family ATPase